jgi:hypothetical protein
MCTEYAAKPLTYGIVVAPAHGTLSPVGPTGQVMYTPAAGFSGMDSFTYDASSTNGSSNVQTISVTVGPNPVGVASAGRDRAHNTEVKISVACTGAPGAHCRLTVTMTTLVRRTHGAPGSTRSQRPNPTKKAVIVGRSSTVMTAGGTMVIRLALNRLGRQRLSSYRKLRVSLVVTQTVGTKDDVVSRQTLTVKARPTRHKTKH